MKLLVTSVRNEALWLLEWIAYHKAIGFNYFLIYTNDNTDRSADLFEHLNTLKYVEIINNQIGPGESPQKKAFSRAFNRIRELSPTWVACLDPDEYFNIKKDYNLDLFLSSLGYPDAVALNWRYYGSSGLMEKGMGFTVERFLQCSVPEFKWNRVFKSIFKFSPQVTGFGPHRPWFKPVVLEDIRYCYPTGQLVDSKYIKARSPLNDDNVYVNFDVAQVNHYAIRSKAEYIAKKARGNGMKANDIGAKHFSDQYFNIRDRNELFDNSIIRLLPGQKREYIEIITALGIQKLMLEIEREFHDFS